jgi:hypothetical protein
VLLDLFGLTSARRASDIAALCGFVIGSFGLNCLVVAAKLHRLLPRLQRAVASAVCGRRAAKRNADLPDLGASSAVEGEAEKGASLVTSEEGRAAAARAVAAARAEVAKRTAELAQARAALDRLRGMGATNTAEQHELPDQAAEGDRACHGDWCRINVARPGHVCRV